jgi:hypothetical protein
MRRPKEIPGNKTKASADRKRIAEVVLAERLGLDDDWMDLEAIPDLPQTLPSVDGSKPADEKEAEEELTILVSRGCRRPVLCWCLEQLGTEADERRKGKVRRLVPAEDESKSQWKITTPVLQTREDMAAFITVSRTYEEALRRVEKELLWTADAKGNAHRLPQGLLTEELPTADEALLLLRQSVAWARNLAEDYRAPNDRLLVKSKGVLFLLAYVWLHTKQSPTSSGNIRESARGRQSPIGSPSRMRTLLPFLLSVTAD